MSNSTRNQTTESDGRKPDDSHVADVIAIFKSLKLDAIKALRRAKYTVKKVKGSKSSFQIDGYDGNMRKSVQKELEAAGFVVKEAQDRHKNTNLIVDRVFPDFMKLDVQVCSISVNGVLFTPPKRFSGLEVKMLKALVDGGHYTPTVEAQTAKASEATAAALTKSSQASILKEFAASELGQSFDMKVYAKPPTGTVKCNWRMTSALSFATVSAKLKAAGWARKSTAGVAHFYKKGVAYSLIAIPGVQVKGTVFGVGSPFSDAEAAYAEASAWTDFLKGKMGKGKSLKELSAEFHKQKDGGDAEEAPAEDAEADDCGDHEFRGDYHSDSANGDFATTAGISPSLRAAWGNYCAASSIKPFRREATAGQTALAAGPNRVTDVSDDAVDHAFRKMKKSIDSVVSTTLSSCGLNPVAWNLILNGVQYGNAELEQRSRPNRIALQTVARELMPRLRNVLACHSAFDLAQCSFLGFGGEVPLVPLHESPLRNQPGTSNVALREASLVAVDAALREYADD